MKHIVAIIIVCAAVFAAYHHSLTGPFCFDDVANIRHNRAIRMEQFSVDALWMAMQESPAGNRPVANATFAVNYWLGKYHTAGWHVVNIAVHAVTGCLVYWFALLTASLASRKPDDTDEPAPNHFPAALVAALIWTLHPLQVQGVTYIVQRMTSLSTAFFMLTLCLYIVGRRRTGRNIAIFVAAGLSWLLAMGSKEIAITLPAIILLYEWFFFQALSRDWAMRHAKYLSVVAVLIIVAAWFYLGGDPWNSLHRRFETRDFTMTERLFTEWRILIFYLSLIACPLPSRLNLDHDITLSTSLFTPVTTAISLVCLAALLVAGVLLAKRHRLLAFAIFWFFINSALESTVIPLELIFEHRMYLVSIAIVVAVVITAKTLIRQRHVRIILAVAVVVALAAGTYRRNLDWRDVETLWTDCAKKSPDKARPQYNLGLFYSKYPNKLDLAIELQERALKADPDHADAHNNLGFIYTEKGQFRDAISHFEHAVNSQDDHWEAHRNLGSALLQLNRHEEALPHFRKSLALNSGNADTRTNYATALLRGSQAAEAAKEFQAALKRDSKALSAMLGLSKALVALNRRGQAIKVLKQAATIHPGSTMLYNNLGILKAQDKRFADAAADFARAIELDSTFVEPRYNLGNALRDQGKFDAALQAYATTVAMQPRYFRAWFNSGRIEVQRGRHASAIKYLKEAVTVDGSHTAARFMLAKTLLKLQQSEEAIPELEHVLSANPQHLQARNHLGVALFQAKRYAACAETFKASLELDPNQPEIHGNLGAVLMNVEQIDEAVQHYRQAVRLAPNDAQLKLKLQAALALQGIE